MAVDESGVVVLHQVKSALIAKIPCSNLPFKIFNHEACMNEDINMNYLLLLV